MLLLSICHAIPFPARALKKNIFFDVDIVVNVTVPSGSSNNSNYNNKTTKDNVWRSGGTPLRNRRDRRLHSITKSLNLSPQRS